MRFLESPRILRALVMIAPIFVVALTVAVGYVLIGHDTPAEGPLSAIQTLLVGSAILVVPLVLFAGHRYHRAFSAQLRDSEERFRSTFEQAAVGIAHVAPNGGFLRINDRFCEIVGYTRDEMLARTFQDITHPDDLDADLENVQRLLRGEEDTYAISKRYLHKNGAIVWIDLAVSLLRDDTGHPRWFVSVVEDVTDRLKFQQERNRILETSSDLICVAGMDGFLNYINPVWERILGYSEGELLDRPFVDFIHPDDREKTDLEIASLATGRPTVDFENRYVCKDGSIRHVAWVATPIPDEQLIYCIGRDTTARKQSERRISEYQGRLRSLASKLTIAEDRERRAIAADLHDHVAGALALTRLQLARVRKGLPAGDPNDAQLEQISQTMQQAIQDTRTLIFELSSPSLEELGLGAAIEEWKTRQIEDKHGLQVQLIDTLRGTEPDDDLRAILFRSIRELLTNVVKHASATSVVIRLDMEDGRMVVTVQDDGLGFDPASVPSGDPTFGLFSIQERMRDLGGAFEIESRPGAGCTAVLRVPLQLS